MNNKTNTLEKDFNQYVLVEEKQVELYDGSKKTIYIILDKENGNFISNFGDSKISTEVIEKLIREHDIKKENFQYNYQDIKGSNLLKNLIVSNYSIRAYYNFNPAVLKMSKDEAIEFLSNAETHWGTTNLIPIEYYFDKKFVLELVNRNVACCFDFLGKELKQDKDLYLHCAKHGYKVAEYFDEKIFTDLECVYTAVETGQEDVLPPAMFEYNNAVLLHYAYTCVNNSKDPNSRVLKCKDKRMKNLFKQIQKQKDRERELAQKQGVFAKLGTKFNTAYKQMLLETIEQEITQFNLESCKFSEKNKI